MSDTDWSKVLGLARISSLSTRNRRGGETAEAMGST